MQLQLPPQNSVTDSAATFSFVLTFTSLGNALFHLAGIFLGVQPQFGESWGKRVHLVLEEGRIECLRSHLLPLPCHPVNHALDMAVSSY